MDGEMALSTNKAPLFVGTEYSSWRERMKIYLKSRGSIVWDSVVSKPWYLTTSTKKIQNCKRSKEKQFNGIKSNPKWTVKPNQRKYGTLHLC
jgi:hypothetical protein